MRIYDQIITYEAKNDINIFKKEMNFLNKNFKENKNMNKEFFGVIDKPYFNKDVLKVGSAYLVEIEEEKSGNMFCESDIVYKPYECLLSNVDAFKLRFICLATYESYLGVDIDQILSGKVRIFPAKYDVKDKD